MKVRFVLLAAFILAAATISAGCPAAGTDEADVHAFIDQLVDDGIKGADSAKLVEWNDSMPAKQIKAGLGEASEEADAAIEAFGEGSVVAEVEMGGEFGKVQFLGYEETPDEELFAEFTEDDLNRPQVAFWEADGEVQDEDYGEILAEEDDNPFLD